jgi:hypothetical protein
MDGYFYASPIIIISQILTKEFIDMDKLKLKCLKIIWNSESFQTIIKKQGYVYLYKGELGIDRDMVITDFNIFRANCNPSLYQAKSIIRANEIKDKHNKI